jgi:hypothetical protein
VQIRSQSNCHNHSIDSGFEAEAAGTATATDSQQKTTGAKKVAAEEVRQDRQEHLTEDGSLKKF